MNRLIKLSMVLFVSWTTAPLLAEECSHLWKRSMAINPEGPKPMSGDSYAAYGLTGWYDEPNLRLELRGEFPPGRFMSVQTYRTKKKRHVDALFDYQFVADPGSQNPFHHGVALETSPRSFRVDIVKDKSLAVNQNVVLLDSRTSIHSLFYRYYSPHDGITPTAADLPKIYAYDTVTGEERNCPDYIDTQFDPGFVTFLMRFIKTKEVLDFERNRDWDNGVNHAVPGYVFAISKVAYDAVSLIRFKAPTFTNTFSGVGTFSGDEQTRYWSMCLQNIKESETLACLPDYLAKIDENGFVTLAISRDHRAQAHAEKLGINFLEDRREIKQKVLAYFYRNLLVNESFEPYQGDYLPVGRVCTLQEFTGGSCTLD